MSAHKRESADTLRAPSDSSGGAWAICLGIRAYTERMRLLLALLAVATHLPAQSAPCTASDALHEIFVADQDDRKVSPIDWGIVGRRDRERRGRVAELIAAGEVRCPADLYRAALVYQHGYSPRHYLLAHIFATAAAIQGHEPAILLSASTLDRYLQRIGRPQVLGTQLGKLPGEDHWSPEPFDREMLPDFVRQMYNVSGLADLEARLERMNQTDPP